MVKFAAALILLALASTSIAFSEKNYYWREYTGRIPSDAIVGGQDINRGNVYVGQAYLRNRGLIPVQINPGTKQVYVEFEGVNQVDRYIKILCGSLENFKWISSNISTLRTDLLNNDAVIGGHEDGLGITNIGRISYEDSTQIGKILSYNLFSNTVYTPYYYCVDRSNKQRRATSYEVLVYVDTNPKHL